MPMIALMDIVAATIYKKQMYWLLMLLTFIGLKRLPFEISSLFWTRLKEKLSLFQGEGFQVQRLFIKSIAKRCQFEENNVFVLCIVVLNIVINICVMFNEPSVPVIGCHMLAEDIQ